MLTAEDFNKELADLVGVQLKEKKQTIAVAESVTAGQLQTCLSLADKALDFFQGGITAYNIGQKSKHLGIDPIHSLATDCVSEKVARTMAKQVTKLFNSDWGISVTGYASPVPERNIEELFACFAICFNDRIIECQTISAQKNEPLAVRHYYSQYILHTLLEILKKHQVVAG